MSDYHRILIIKPSSLGDVLHALPTLAALRDRFPSAHIAWLVKQQWGGILERVEGLNHIWRIEPGVKGWVSHIPALRAAAFDLVIDLQGLFRSGAMAWLTGSPTRVGFANGREGSPLFYSQRVPIPTPDMHAVDRYRLVAAAVGAVAAGEPEFRLQSTSTDREQIARLLGKAGLTTGATWIGMNVSARWETKRWPLEYFAQVADAIHESGLGRVGLIGSVDDREAAHAVKLLMRTKPVDLTGQTAIEVLPALLESAALLFTNDSGPMHIAAAVGTPVVALFGPTSPVRTGPYGHDHRVLTSAVPCRPCFSRVCRNHIPLDCLKSIDPKVAFEAVRERLASQAAS